VVGDKVEGLKKESHFELIKEMSPNALSNCQALLFTKWLYLHIAGL
jgi:hypothetical protein